jgi:hypothetical protein
VAGYLTNPSGTVRSSRSLAKSDQPRVREASGTASSPVGELAAAFGIGRATVYRYLPAADTIKVPRGIAPGMKARYSGIKRRDIMGKASSTCLSAYVTGVLTLGVVTSSTTAQAAPASMSELQAWGQAVCDNPDGNKDIPPRLYRVSPWTRNLPSAMVAVICTDFYPLEDIGNKGSSYDVSMTIASYSSIDGFNRDIAGARNWKFPLLGYALKEQGGEWWIVVASAGTVLPDPVPRPVPGIAMRNLQALRQYGFTVKSA